MARSSSTSSTNAAASSVPPTYEAALAELEQLVGQMESGALPLEQLLNSYQRGAELLKFCRGRLQAVEEQVKLLEDGQLKSWDAE
ncbi:MAG: exodeoxyribonuclease VII small subunit [Aquabacterium sp.]|jgi:exodeoxyribonuclease VII small subunit|uniref:exodeoxyribonuclease VII small subunit n=1 Tax=Aquabacterium sp. TaxID=1872578 RepID=UPI002A369503|nr:exodeoxyribonuclease VII small subunit [Aquabacterium sp.]MDX9842875.1 exodeoxyribonuclease VII small subunit [Aquabacterium sp.]